MSNLGLGQTAWNRFFRELGVWLAPIKCLRNEARRFNNKRNRIQVFERNDVNGFTSAWTLSGVKIGTNTDEDGLLYVRITDGTPNTVDVYKAAGAGAGNKVATGTANDGATCTLTAANSSGLTGTVLLGTVTANETDDKHRLEVFPDWGLRAPIVWDNTVADDPESTRLFLDALVRAENQVNLAITQLENGLRAWLAARWARLMGSGQSDPIDASATPTDGVVETTYEGLLEDGRLNMRDETTPAAQTIVKNAVSASSGSFDSQNQGQGSLAAPSMEEWALNCLLRAECVDSTIGAEEFSITAIDSVTGEKRRSQNNLRVKKEFSDPILGIRSATLLRTMTITNNTNNFAAASNHTITGETSLNTNDGVLYLQIKTGINDPAKFFCEFYKASTYGTTELVGKTEEGAAAATVAINERRDSGLGGSFKLGAAPADGTQGTLNLNTFRKKNTNGVTDKFTSTVTVASRGEFADGIAKAFNYRLNSATSGAETIDDSYVSAGTFPAFEVRDV